MRTRTLPHASCPTQDVRLVCGDFAAEHPVLRGVAGFRSHFLTGRITVEVRVDAAAWPRAERTAGGGGVCRWT
jgi:hypothetical protein